MNTLGLDVGGANIKAAHSSLWTHSAPFAVWREPAKLTDALRDIMRVAPPFDRIAVAMTAELCDCFETKRDGVIHVIDCVLAAANNCECGVWITQGCFVSPQDAKTMTLAVAASNWHAMATWLAHEYSGVNALWIDCGSTTTDIIPFGGGAVLARGKTDTERLSHGELVYIGVRRTPLMALGPTIEFAGGDIGLMNELFATMDDVMLLTGEVPERPDDRDTADGRPRAVRYAHERIARMIGADSDTMDRAVAQRLARAFADKAVSRLAGHVAAVGKAHHAMRIYVSGSGETLALATATGGLPNVDVQPLSKQLGAHVSTAACAHALVRLMDG